ncbi:MAG: hypothetical protein ACAH09_02160 [Methylophilaceae bacterium]|jgi:hypothetical protein
MDAHEFVLNWKVEKENLLSSFMDSGKTLVGKKISELQLTSQQLICMKEVLNLVLTDTMYGLLLGLDGEALIGDTQHVYKIFDESGNLISKAGDIEGEAWQQFHGE